MMDHSDKFHTLIHHHYPDSTLLRVWTLKGGASAQMTALELRHADGQTQKLIVRQPNLITLTQSPSGVGNEFRLLKHLKSQGIVVPTPYLLDESLEILPTPYMIIEFIDGEPDFAPTDLEGYIRQFAHQLAQIHAIDPAHPDIAFLTEQTDTVERLTRRAATAESASLEGRIYAAIQQFGDISSVAPALLHGDFWHGNLLWNRGQLVAVIDWEDAHIGNPLLDFAVSRLDWCLIFGVEAMEIFTRYYQEMTTLDMITLSYWDLLAALRAAPSLAMWASVFNHFGRPDMTEQTMTKRLDTFVQQTFERLSK